MWQNISVNIYSRTCMYTNVAAKSLMLYMPWAALQYGDDHLSMLNSSCL